MTPGNVSSLRLILPPDNSKAVDRKRNPGFSQRTAWSLCVTAFAVSLVAWVVSETWAIGRAGSYSGYAFGWYLIDGELDICLHRHPGFCPYPADWFFMDSNGDFSFEMSYIDGEVVEMWSIYVPVWPVCGALGVFCVWMWRKRRRRRGTGAFPVAVRGYEPTCESQQRNRKSTSAGYQSGQLERKP